MKCSSHDIELAFRQASDRYAQCNVDVQQALATLATTTISMHCWQGDDVGGFEGRGDDLGGGLAVTGSYPGKASTPVQLREDIEKALSLIPGSHRLNLHAFYGEFSDKRVARNEIGIEHFGAWIDWAKEQKLGLDFNPTCFSHPYAADGFTLSHTDRGIRTFWIEHCIACREIGAAMGKALNTPAVTNVWIPDGYKDMPVDRFGPRERLASALDEIFAMKFSSAHLLDAVECKLFGLGSECYVVGSHEFYLGYAIKKQLVLCLDAGHFHPTESIADKISSVLMYVPEILLHVSRGVRWDSDHVVIQDDALMNIAHELVRNPFLDRTHIGLDFFDASINRIAAWVIGTRCTLRALLIALLEPPALKNAEVDSDLTSRLAWMEESKGLPWQAIWDQYCLQSNVPVGVSWLEDVKKYESSTLSQRTIRPVMM